MAIGIITTILMYAGITLLGVFVFLFFSFGHIFYKNESVKIDKKTRKIILKDLATQRKDIRLTKMMGIILDVVAIIGALLFSLNFFLSFLSTSKTFNIILCVLSALLLVGGTICINTYYIRVYYEFLRYNKGENINFDKYVKYEFPKTRQREDIDDNADIDDRKKMNDEFLKYAKNLYKIAGIILCVGLLLITGIILFVPMEFLGSNISLLDYVKMIIESSNGFIDALKDVETVGYIYIALFFILSYLNILFSFIGFLTSSSKLTITHLYADNIKTSSFIYSLFLISSINSCEKFLLELVDFVPLKIAAYIFISLYIITFLFKIFILEKREGLFKNAKKTITKRLSIISGIVFHGAVLAFVICFFDVAGFKVFNMYPQYFISNIATNPSAMTQEHVIPIATTELNFTFLLIHGFSIIISIFAIVLILSAFPLLFLSDDSINDMYGNGITLFDTSFSGIKRVIKTIIIVIIVAVIVFALPLMLDGYVAPQNMLNISVIYNAFKNIYFSMSNIIFAIAIIVFCVLARILSVIHFKNAQKKKQNELANKE